MIIRVSYKVFLCHNIVTHTGIKIIPQGSIARTAVIYTHSLHTINVQVFRTKLTHNALRINFRRTRKRYTVSLCLRRCYAYVNPDIWLFNLIFVRCLHIYVSLVGKVRVCHSRKLKRFGHACVYLKHVYN